MPFCHALEIPAIHYMVAAAGGNTIPCVPYATYGTPELCDYVTKGMADRNAVIMQHHGMIAAGETLGKAMWLAEEVETLVRMYLKVSTRNIGYCFFRHIPLFSPPTSWSQIPLQT